MKIRLLAAAALVAMTIPLQAATGWLTEPKEAMAAAKEKNRPVLVEFTGSDWCPPCIMMKKRVFDTQAFQGYAQEHLVLLEQDFPQSLPPNDPKIVERLKYAEKLGVSDPSTGSPVFPTLVMLDPSGKVLDVRRGAVLSPQEFIAWLDGARAKM